MCGMGVWWGVRMCVYVGEGVLLLLLVVVVEEEGRGYCARNVVRIHSE